MSVPSEAGLVPAVIGNHIIPDYPEWLHLAEPFTDATDVILAEWAAQDRAGIWPLPQRRPAGEDVPQPDDEAADRVQRAAEEALKRAGVTDEDIADLHGPRDDTQATTANLPGESEKQ